MKQLDIKVHRVLEYLYDADYGNKKDILPLLSELFPINDINNRLEREEKNILVRNFYKKLVTDNLIEADNSALASLANGYAGKYNWLNDLQPIMVSITEKGGQILEKEHKRLRNLSITSQQAKSMERPIKKILSKWRTTYSARRTLYDAIIIIVAIATLLLTYLSYIK